MGQRRHSWLAGGLLVIWLMAIFIGGAQPFAVGLLPPPWDKIAHTAVYLVLGILLRCSLRLSLAISLVLTLAVGGLDEWHQAFIPGRLSSIGDWLADSVGAMLGVVILGRAASVHQKATLVSR